MASSKVKGPVCVTGASGYIGSWLVMRLLEQGYTVHATVRDPENKEKVRHLVGLPGARERLKMFKVAGLNEEMAFDDAVRGCEGVFHLASPVTLADNALQGEIVGPTVRGTIHVIQACKRAETVKRIIYTSSVSAVRYTGKHTHHNTLDESHWTSVDYCRNTKMLGWMYCVAKTYAEESAIKLGLEQEMEVITILPSVTVGDFLTPEVPSSVATLMALPKGDERLCSSFARVPYVHIEDVVRAHIYLYEHPDACGRYICSLQDVRLQEAALLFQNRHHLDFPITKFENLGEDYLYPCVTSEKLKQLGFEYKKSLEDTIDDVVQSYKKRDLF